MKDKSFCGCDANTGIECSGSQLGAAVAWAPAAGFPFLMCAALYKALLIIKLSAPLGNYANGSSTFRETLGLR